VNTVFQQREADRIYQLLKYLAAAGPDGIIVQDFGVLMLAREFPSLRIHASTQMNIAGARGANALSKYGVSRVVLARELSIGEIRETRNLTNLELEVFVHGALCISESGLCLFSSYLGGKSANRGLCTQACRRLYTTGTGGAQPEKGSSRDFAEGAYYFFSPCDLSLIARVRELAEAGVSSVKIEGRMKSAEYVGAVVSAYRLVIDSLGAGEDEQRRALEDARLILQHDFARPKTEYLYGSASGEASPPAWLRPDQAGGTGISLGTLLKVRGSGDDRQSLVRSHITLTRGDSLRFHKADDSRRLSRKLLHASGPKSGSAGRESSAGASGDWWISVPEGFDPGDSVYLIQTKAMTKQYPFLMPKDLSSFRRSPGRDRAPAPVFPRYRGERKDQYPPGIYAAVSSVEDLYVLQAARPAGVFLPLDRKTLPLLSGDSPLPFKSGELILSLDPFFPQGDDAFFTEAIPLLYQRGYRRFMLNNPGHFSLFNKINLKEQSKGSPCLIGGPYLYTFNAWSAGFVLSLGADYVVTPLENSRQNLEKTVAAAGQNPRQASALRAKIFVTLLAWPALFRIRSGLK
jgi:putative protease